jgi:uncharacterized protein YecA (UPF0149 family)
MRWAVAHETEAARLARAAKSDMRAHYSFDAVGHTAKRLLSELPAFALDATGKSVFDRRAPVTLAGGAVARTGRNAPCPCGSAQKFKNCHGAIRFEVEESRKLRPWSGA